METRHKKKKEEKTGTAPAEAKAVTRWCAENAGIAVFKNTCDELTQALRCDDWHNMDGQTMITGCRPPSFHHYVSLTVEMSVCPAVKIRSTRRCDYSELTCLAPLEG